MTDWWFFALLLVNLVVVAVYLLWFLLFKPEQDNRAQFIMQAVIMLLCPLVGPLFFLCVFLKARFVELGHRDLSDVEFSKRRHAVRLKADE